MTVIDHYRAAFERFAAARSEPGWLRTRRADAFERFAQTGFPTRRDEDWKYVRLGAFASDPFTPSARHEDTGVDEAVAEASIDGAVAQLVFVSGRFDAARSSIGDLAPGIRIRQFVEAARTDLTNPFPADVSTGFGALHEAFATDGVVIDFAPETLLSAPVQIVHVGARAETPALSAVRNIVRLGGHARGTLVESFVGVPDAEYLVLTATTVRFGDGAHLDHVRIQNDAAAAGHVATDDVVINRDGTYRGFRFSLGAALSRDTSFIRVEGSGAHTDLAALYVPGAGQTVDHHTTIDHRAPHCSANQLYKGILDDDGHGVFNGRIFVRQAAQQTAAEQLNQNLMLSRAARIDTKPQLEIFADDVRCTHGATVGQIEPEELFYMMSRAIPEDAARRMLVRGFADEALQRVEDLTVLEQMRSLLDARLAG